MRRDRAKQDDEACMCGKIYIFIGRHTSRHTRREIRQESREDYRRDGARKHGASGQQHRGGGHVYTEKRGGQRHARGRENAGPAATGVAKWSVIVGIIITFALLEEIEPKTENGCACVCMWFDERGELTAP